MMKRILSLATVLLLSSCGSDSGGTTGPNSVPASVSVSPPTVTLDAIGATTQFSATVRNQDGETLSGASVSWSTSNASVLSINSSSGLATAVAPGDASVTATSGGVSGSAAATVRQVPVQVQVSVSADHLPPGSTAQATLAALDAGGHAISSPTVTWESGTPATATVDAQGVVTAVSPGLVYIKGSMESLSDSVRVSVSSALEGDQLTTETGADGEAAVFTALGGGTHLQLSVEDGFGQPLIGATAQYAEVGGKALLVLRGPGGGYAPAFLYGTIEELLVLGDPLPVSGANPSANPNAAPGPQATIAQAARLSITLPAVSSVELSILSDALRIPTFFYSPAPVALGTDGPFRGRRCLTWDAAVQHMKDSQTLIPGWADAVVTLVRSSGASFFDPAPLVGEADVFFPTAGVVGGLTGSNLLAEKVNLLGAMPSESTDGRRVEVSWEFADGGPAIRQALGWYEIRTNDPYCGGALPETLSPLPPTLSGAPGSQHQSSVKVESVWGNPIPGVSVDFSLSSAAHGSLDTGGIEVTKATDDDGMATVSWTLPASEGNYLLSASVAREGASPLVASISGEAKVPLVEPTPASLAMGPDHTCALTPEDGAFCWGTNQWGELGIGLRGSGNHRTVPDEVLTSKTLGFQALSAGVAFTCALDSNNRAYCWGRNDLGQQGSGWFTDVWTTPTAVEGGFQFTQLVSGWHHSCGLTAGGLAYCWGGNDQGQLGDGTQTNRLQPVAVAGGLIFESLTAGGSHSCGITTGGAAYCWGKNAYGALGDGTHDPHLNPSPVLPVASFESLTAGEDHTCGLTASGAVYCWGRNAFGQLGIGNKTDISTPTLVTGPGPFSSVHTTGTHTCGIAAGVSYCWGRNHLGQIGSTLLSDMTSPYEVRNQENFQVLAAGPFHTCALTGDGTAYCWGSNSSWQLGQGESPILFSSTPLEVITDWRFGRPPS